jgi:hypothetical protein
LTPVRAVAPASDIAAILIGADFIDAYKTGILQGDFDATAAAQAMMRDEPAWVRALVATRNAIVAPFGLKVSGEPIGEGSRKIGIFPIVSATPSRLVMGFDDAHLDFRVVIDVAEDDFGRTVTATTLVRYVNGFGRVYLTVIKPFHKLIVRSMLRRMAAHISDNIS